jgi:6-phosphofructokinase 1
MVDFLEELSISVVFTIGGDGTLRGAQALAKEIHKRALPIAVIGIPKTIDNDIPFVEKTFGFETAVAASREVIQSAHVESKGTENGIGLVKLMGRDSGFIAAQAALANADVNFCLIPEVAFTLEGPGGFLQQLETRLRRRRHAVIVVAEGAGQPLMSADPRTDASGNILYEDIGVYLKNRIADYFRRIDMPASVKYIDPSYIIRSKPANANDSLFCLRMGQHAVHAGLAGKTEMMVGYWNQHFTHVPLKLATLYRKKVDPHGELWRTVLAVTEQGQPGQNAQ